MSQYKLRFTTTDKITRLKGQIIKRGKKRSFIHATNQMYHNAILRDVCSSLAIENDSFSLTLQQVTGIVDGNYAYANEANIQAVENAYKAYSAVYHRQYESIDVYSTAELLGMHRVFMTGFSEQAGCYRSYNTVSRRMDDLLQWVKVSKEDVLVKSCVFHYELMTLRPFSEGNGLMARMWQTLLHMQSWFIPIRMPIWGVVHKRRQEYYDVLAIPDKEEGLTKFIEFMLQAISDAMAEFEKDPTH